MAKIDREQILSFLREHKDELHTRFGVTRLGLVGSYPRGDANAESDLAGYYIYVGEANIDLATEASLKPTVKESILKDIRYV